MENKKSFTQYLKESAEGQEYIIKILIRGTEEHDYPLCHEQCAQLGKTEEGNKPLCNLFGGELKETEGDLSKIPVRNTKCKATTDRLI
jgi:hypothetical protein